jgi:hypothetical protein
MMRPYHLRHARAFRHSGSLALVLMLPPAVAPAQEVSGRVAEAQSGRPIAGARVTLVDSAAAAVDSTTTGSDGSYRVAAPGPGRFLVHVEVDGYLSYSDGVRLGAGEVAEHRVEMPVISVAAAVVMQEVIDREAAFQLPLEELCEEPLRPWEAGMLVGVARARQSLEPAPRAVVRLETFPDSIPSDAAAYPARSRVATTTGAYWFCNVPAGRARLVVRAEGFAPDTSVVIIRAGTMSWYDALLR